MSEYRDNLIKEIREEIESAELCCDGCKCILPSECDGCSVASHVTYLEMQLDDLLNN